MSGGGGRLLLFVTGASRGFGRCVAEEFVRQVAATNPVDLVLVARSESGLQSTSDAVDEIAKGIHIPGGAAADVVVRREALDLGDLDQLEASLEVVFSRIDPLRYSRAMLINNAASLGHITFANELPSLAILRSEMDFNITSSLWLSSRFAAMFGAKKSGANGDGTTCDLSNNVVVNVSSPTALNPHESWSMYSSGKAARNMFHRALANEQASIGGLKVLNYDPGQMSTDMARGIQTADQFEAKVQSGELVDARVSAEKCVKLVVRGPFGSGSHISFLDK